ncbi:putative ISXo8 transposase [Streptomyces hiroshimensis]|uniref:ISXo8 transposase n=2 Tax=Streptomyces hiroshimensis TaxID=66424 RepID=A0ABQ2YTP3_9ACTN|nr:transposase [Streptomyces hiroshimensis]GGX93327.1 putative ISXo8 transposase [Streptomyces hiroshimensis]
MNKAAMVTGLRHGGRHGGRFPAAGGPGGLGPGSGRAAGPGAVSAAGPGIPDDLVAEMAEALFRSLRRSDQRSKGEQYLHGLLAANGRKTIQNIAGAVDAPGGQQSLHHFICSSTWHWNPLREALAHYVEGIAPARAWVVRQLIIPKRGEHSVGVRRQFDPELGETVNAQRAFGVWLASGAMTVPVHWRLFLPDGADGADEQGAGIPASALREETADESATGTVLDDLRKWKLPRRPVVLDVPTTRVGPAVRRFAEAGLPVLARVCGATRLVVAEPALPGHGLGPVPALRILQGVRGLRRRIAGAGLVAAVPVTLPVGHGRLPAGGQRPGLLLGEWRDPEGAPERIWLTDMVRTPVGELARLARLAHDTAADCEEVGARVGLRDFKGRSFPGWHRHMTLSSAAYAVSSLTSAYALTGEALYA